MNVAFFGVKVNDNNDLLWVRLLSGFDVPLNKFKLKSNKNLKFK